MPDLQELRKQIDEIDNAMVQLFEKRMSIAEQVASYKIETGKPVFDEAREQEKLHALGKRPILPLTAAESSSSISRSCRSAGNASISFFRLITQRTSADSPLLTA